MVSTLKNRNKRSRLYIKNDIYVLEKVLEKDFCFTLLLLMCCLHFQGVSGVGSDELSVKEGGSVRLEVECGVKTNQQDQFRWYFNNIRIAQTKGDFTKTCTDVQCNEGTERFRGRLKLDHQTGSLTIMNTRTTDSGEYHLQIISGGDSNNQKTYRVNVQGYFSDGTEGVSVFLMERDSVTFQTNVETNQQDRIRWYYNNNLLAEITGDQSKICTDDECKERFRDRLKLDEQTGSLTITNIRTTDSGLFDLVISGKNIDEKKRTFKFFIHDVSAAAEPDELKKKKGESVTLYTGVINHHDLVRWYFNDTLLAEITEDQSKICEDDQCHERFRDRLKLDHQTGSLTIMNTTTTDSGEYHQQINSSRFSISRSFTVSVDDPGQSLSPAGGTAAVVIGVVAGIVLLVAVAVGVYCKHKKQKDTEDQNKLNERMVMQKTCSLLKIMKSACDEMSTNQDEDLMVDNEAL